MKSIIQDYDGSCFLCRALYWDDSRKTTEEHHAIFGRGRRELSEKYGLKVRLCLYHHRIGPEAVHNNRDTADIVRWAAQKKFEEKYSHEKWMEVFGKNYLPEEEREEIREEPGFFLLEGEENESDEGHI